MNTLTFVFSPIRTHTNRRWLYLARRGSVATTQEGSNVVFMSEDRTESRTRRVIILFEGLLEIDPLSHLSTGSSPAQTHCSPRTIPCPGDYSLNSLQLFTFLIERARVLGQFLVSGVRSARTHRRARPYNWGLRSCVVSITLSRYAPRIPILKW